MRSLGSAPCSSQGGTLGKPCIAPVTNILPVGVLPPFSREFSARLAENSLENGGKTHSLGLECFLKCFGGICCPFQRLRVVIVFFRPKNQKSRHLQARGGVPPTPPPPLACTYGDF